MLEATGYEFRSNGGMLYVTNESSIVLKGVRKNTLYHLIFEQVVKNNNMAAAALEYAHSDKSGGGES